MASLNLAPYTLLLVDDVEFSRKTVERLLQSMGGPMVETADDGARALDILRASKAIDFVISDFNMPVMNGLQLLRAIRSGDAGVARGMPFAMLTGFSDKHLVDMALALDVNAFLVKPVSKATLTQRLEKMLVRGDDELWVKSADLYGATFIEEAETDGAAAAVTRDDQIKAYQAMRRETPPEGEAEAEPGSAGIDPRQMGRSAAVMRRLSSLKGKFDETDLAHNINTGVDRLISDSDDRTASRIVSYLDGLVKQDILDIEDLPAVLSVASMAETDAVSADAAAEDAAAPAPAAAPAGGESFCVLTEIPAGTTLARNLNAVDGSLFMTKGTPLTRQIVAILVHLGKIGVLALETVDGKDGIFVTAAGAPEPAPEAAAAPESSGETQVAIEDVEVGAVITRDIYTVDGRLYLPAGSQLSRRIIAILQDLDHLGNIQSQLWVAA